MSPQVWHIMAQLGTVMPFRISLIASCKIHFCKTVNITFKQYKLNSFIHSHTALNNSVLTKDWSGMEYGSNYKTTIHGWSNSYDTFFLSSCLAFIILNCRQIFILWGLCSRSATFWWYFGFISYSRDGRVWSILHSFPLVYFCSFFK